MWRYIRRSVMILGAALLPVAISGAQSKPAEAQFDVVSVKPNIGSGPQNLRVTPGRAQVTNIPLNTLLQFAYQVQARALVGAPDWIREERFDILATADPNSTMDQTRAMLKAMLEDRFQLIARKEVREIPIYALVVARRDGKLGPKLQTATVDCAGNGNGRPLAGAPQDAAAQDPSKRCLILPLFGQGRFQGRGLHMENIASALNNLVDRTIVDKTGLPGPYEFDLTWIPDALLQPRAAAATGKPADLPGPSLFTAIEEQLGLKLDPQRGQAEVLVIDRVAHPKPD
jgi:uncharacterized protein (TIGR03435 family)